MTIAFDEDLGTAAVDRGGRSIEVRFRRVHTLDEYRQCEVLQARVWGPHDIVGIPMLGLLTAQENGGLVIGAFASGTHLVGLVYSFPGLTPDGAVKQCSVLMGVDPEYQNAGIGYHLKLAQRRAALALGIDLITWTVDPLVSRNAYLNLGKLGCIAPRYQVNVYGTVDHGLNAGIETDRLHAEWWLRAPRVERHLRSGAPRLVGSGVPVNEVAIDPRWGVEVHRGRRLDRDEPVLLVEVPADIQAVKRASLTLARAWRLETRQIFLAYLSRGYVVVGFERLAQDQAMRWCHILQRGTPA